MPPMPLLGIVLEMDLDAPWVQNPPPADDQAKSTASWVALDECCRARHAGDTRRTPSAATAPVPTPRLSHHSGRGLRPLHRQLSG